MHMICLFLDLISHNPHRLTQQHSHFLVLVHHVLVLLHQLLLLSEKNTDLVLLRLQHRRKMSMIPGAEAAQRSDGRIKYLTLSLQVFVSRKPLLCPRQLLLLFQYSRA